MPPCRTRAPGPPEPGARDTRHGRRRARGALLALAPIVPLVLTLAGCHGSADEAGAVGPAAGFDNVLLVTLDTTRADRLGCYGHADARTPVLDGLAARGVRFESCFASAPTTLASHASILTGLHPYRHGARNNGTHYLPDEVETLAERLTARGFATGAVVSAVVLDSRFGLDQGFETYDDDLSAARATTAFKYRETTADDTARRALAWLAGRDERRWFLWLHFFDPHANYAPPADLLPGADGVAGDAYDGEIAFADRELGRVLDALRSAGTLGRTLIVATADHGEALGEHGEPTHSIFVYDATTRVPWILSHPELAQGRVVRSVVQTVDIVPTVASLLGLPAATTDGRSLAGVVRTDRAEPPPVAAYSEAMSPRYDHGWADLRTLRTRTHRYVRAPRAELYDLTTDAGQRTDVGATQPAPLSELARTLDDLLPPQEADVRGSASGDPALRRALEDLGYVQSTSAADPDRDDDVDTRVDPKDGIAALSLFLAAREHVAARRWREAEAILAELTASAPDWLQARTLLASALAEQGRLEEAVHERRATLMQPGVQVEDVLRLADLEHALDPSPEGAWQATLRHAQGLAPRDPAPWVRAARFALARGDLDTADAATRAALARDAGDADALRCRAALERARGRLDAARDTLALAVGADPSSAAAWRDLAVLDLERGDVEGARSACERALDLDALHEPTRVQLVGLHLAAGRVAEARRVVSAGLRAAATPSIELLRQALVAAALDGDLDRALEHGRDLLDRAPDDMTGLMTVAACHARRAADAQAEALLGRALALDAPAARERARRDPALARVLARIDAR